MHDYGYVYNLLVVDHTRGQEVVRRSEVLATEVGTVAVGRRVVTVARVNQDQDHLKQEIEEIASEMSKTEDLVPRINEVLYMNTCRQLFQLS